MPGQRILIIDDEAEHAELVALLLGRQGYVVDVASDGPSGIEAARMVRPDLVLLDVFMPAVDGITTAEELRADKRTRGVPIVLVTACSEDIMRSRKQLEGKFSYLAKPFRAAELTWVVEDALSFHGALQVEGMDR